MNKDTFSDVRVILLSGEEFQRSERLAEILDTIVEKATRDFNLDVFAQETSTQKEFPIKSMYELIITFPMMAKKRVIVIRDFDKLHSEVQKKVSEVIQKTPDTTLVIIEGEKVAFKPKLSPRHFKVEMFKPIYENKIPSWIRNRFAKRGKKVTPEAVALLMNNVGNVLREMDSEIEKVTIASHDNDIITEQDVSQVVGTFRHDTIWNLCNAIGLDDFDSAANILTNLVESEKNRETFYVSTIASHIIKIAAYNSLINKGTSHSEAMKVLAGSPFLWKLNKMDSQTRNFEHSQVRHTLTTLASAESVLKRFSVNKRLLMELLIPIITQREANSSET